MVQSMVSMTVLGMVPGTVFFLVNASKHGGYELDQSFNHRLNKGLAFEPLSLLSHKHKKEEEEECFPPSVHSSALSTKPTTSCNFQEATQ
jgi:hypothetical protein